MSAPPQSMPPQYAPSTAVAFPESSSTSSNNSMNSSSSNNMTSQGGSLEANQQNSSNATPTVHANATTSNNNNGNAIGTPATTTTAAAGGTGDWRDKDADRSARQQIARIILTLIMKSANRPASVNYNPREIARRLEHTLYMSAASRDDYSNVQTLKARLQQALDNSRRRQMQQQQQQQQQAAQQQVPLAQQTDMTQQQQQLQQQQLQLLQRQQQQQLAAQLQNQRNSFQGVPFSPSHVQMPQQTNPNQPLQMPLTMSQMQVQPPASLPMSNTVPTSSSVSGGVSGSGSSILDELEREADEMANGVSDEPIAMPESELQGAPTTPVSVAGNGSFVGGTPLAPSPGVVSGVPFSGVPLSMPPEISAGLPTSSVTSSTGFVPQQTPAMVSATPTASVNSNLYHGMNLTGPQIQQIQQMQQMQQLRRMQQLQQLQQQQNTSGMPNHRVNASPSSTQMHPANNVSGVNSASANPAGGMMPMSEASIAQKREELKRRLIQLKHARTCTTGECTIDYCNRTKALLAHVSRCANAQCTTIGCKSTRQLLSHFRKCRNLQCDVCSAIRPPMNENEQQLVLRRQQERLCMLRHASTCTATQCVLPYCAGMKVLWKHICECHQRQCRTDHCISSRYVLSHFKQCNKMICEVCGPVRKAIKVVDSCRGNPAQLHIAANQCPDGVRGLIKIMNTTSANGGLTGAAANNHSNTLGSQMNVANPQVTGQNASTPSAAHKRQAASQRTGDSSWSQQQIDMQTGSTKSEGQQNALDNSVHQSGSNSSLGTGNNAVLMAANMALKSTSNSNLPNGTGASALKTEASDDVKKKPLKLQTEKEKKLRRKEQAKIAKARAQAKAQAAANGAAANAALLGSLPISSTGATAPIVSNGLVVRGTQANLRSDHVSHQDISYLDSMTEAQLDEHIRSLRFNFCGHITVTELKNRLMPLLTKLMESEYGWTFNNPVDPVQWNIPDYFDIIKCPMDLGTIKKRLENEHYNSVEAFAGDVRLVFENCIAYNSSTNKFNIAAKQLLASFEKSLAALKAQLEKQLFKRCEQRREEMCQLCGGESFKFAPCMLFCSGPCAGRIRRHTHYYSDPRGEHHWCSSCYKQMKDGPIDMSLLPQLSSAAAIEGDAAATPASAVPFDGVLKKSSLLKRKNSEVAEEPWVECDSCKLWYHQICALFNERNHAISGEQEPFVCPICVKKQRAAGVKPSLENGLKAKRLPITRMAKLIEYRVLEAIEKAQSEEAERMGNLGNSDSIGFSRFGEETASETKFGITIREVLSVDKQVQIKPKMGKLLAEKYGKPKKIDGTSGANTQTKSLKRQRPSSTDGSATGTKKRQDRSGTSTASSSSSSSLQLTYRSRCICVFQELDGVDVLIFTLYVQEYGPDSLEPNAGRVYVSYLDSVNYFQPKKLRTLMHQQVMLGFLEDCKNRGFHTAHIWSCPPLKGDDYIFFCKPENQKIPKSARLRQWYQKLLQQAKKDGHVVNISNLYAEYYLKKKAAHELPYFEGDYWPRLAEDLIKQLEEKSSGGRSEKTGAGEPGTNGADGVSANDSKTPLSRSPSPSEMSVQTENGAFDDSPAATATTDTPSTPAVTSKASVNAKSKKKRSKKAPNPEPPASATRSSTTKTRSKKGAQVGRASSSSKNAVNNDPLMQKLKGILEPQKDDFFVVDLHPKCHKCSVPIVHIGYWQLKTMQPSASVSQLVEAAKKTRTSSSSSRNSPPRHYQHYYCNSCYTANKSQLAHRIEVAANGSKRAQELSERILPLNEKVAAAELADLDLQEIKYELSLKYIDPNGDESEVKPKVEEENEAKQSETTDVAVKKEPEGDNAKDPEGDNVKEVITNTEEADTSAVPKKEEGTTEEPVKSVVPARPSGRVIGDDLDDVIMPCEIFDTREAFLMYCQNNHCQFDQIRRAKHSSMMVLYHLFNQGTTGFTFSCSSCKITLLSGNRWNCSICPVFNLCDDCNAKSKHEHTLHLFKVVPIPRPGEPSNETVSAKVPGVANPGTGKPSGVATPNGSRSIKREAGSSELKRAKLDKTAMPGAAAGLAGDLSSVKGPKTTPGPNRKRKLNQAGGTDGAASLGATGNPMPTAGDAASVLQSSTPANPATGNPSTAAGEAPKAAGGHGGSAGARTATAQSTSAATGGTSSGNGDNAEDAEKKRRIHNIDPQLLLQLEHASGCTLAECTFFNCHRMRAMLKHGAICEQRLSGPCVLCKRIVGLLSAHARQCTKDYTACKVPRCADIRRHFLQQMQQRQEQLERLKQQQQLEQKAPAETATAAANDVAS